MTDIVHRFAVDQLVQVRPRFTFQPWRPAQVVRLEPYLGRPGYYVTYLDRQGDAGWDGSCGWTMEGNLREPVDVPPLEIVDYYTPVPMEHIQETTKSLDKVMEALQRTNCIAFVPHYTRAERQIRVESIGRAFDNWLLESMEAHRPPAAAPDVAINHDPIALELHRQNHPAPTWTDPPDLEHASPPCVPTSKDRK